MRYYNVLFIFFVLPFPNRKDFFSKKIYTSLWRSITSSIRQHHPGSCWLPLLFVFHNNSVLFSILWWLFCSIPTVVAFKACKEFKLHPLKLPVEPPLTRAQQHGGRTDISSPQYSWTSCSISLWAPIKWVQGSPPVFETSSLFVAYPLALVYRPLLLAYASKNTQVSLVLFFSSLLLSLLFCLLEYFLCYWRVCLVAVCFW